MGDSAAEGFTDDEIVKIFQIIIHSEPLVYITDNQ